MRLKEKIAIIAIFFSAAFFIAPKMVWAQVIFNEVAWMGTTASASDEWLELYNNTAQEIVIEGWKLTEGEGTVIIVLKGTIAPGAYYLIERTDDTTVSDIAADLKGSWSGSGLSNNGEKIQLLDNNSNLVDEINCSTGWFAGKASPDYKTMERINPSLSGNLAENWATNDDSALIGHDSQGNPIKGTPKTKNSVAGLSLTTLSPTPSPSSSPAPASNNETISSASPTPTPTLYQYSQDIFINEFLPWPANEAKEWVELFNAGSATVNIAGWQIDDADNSTSPQAIPANTDITPGEFLVITFNKNTLNNDGDKVRLLWPDDQVVHAVSYDKAKQGQAVAKFDAGWLWTNQPTPEQVNKKSFTEKNETVSLSVAPNSADKITTIEEAVAVQTGAPRGAAPVNQKIITPTVTSSENSPIADRGAPESNLLAAAASKPTGAAKNNSIFALIGVLFLAAAAGGGLIYFRRQKQVDIEKMDD